MKAMLRDAVARARYVLPRGGSLPSEIWERRHRGVILLLLGHAAGIGAWSLIKGWGPAHSLLDTLPVALAVLVASRRGLSRTVRASAAALGLMVSSALLVHLSAGYIEFHFHFFVMVAFIALYQDWVPFLLAVSFVVVHHGFLGTVAPASVFNHQGAIENPWPWALLHGLFLLAASAAGLIAWKANEYHALHDPLTRLANRALFVDRLENALARAERYGRSLAVLIVDLDGFKAVNDRLGHAVGDHALIEATERLKSCLRGSDTAARLGGDEFAVVLEDVDEAGASLVAARVVQALRHPFSLAGQELEMGGSVGVAFSRNGTSTPDELIRAADAAMYEAKRDGKSRASEAVFARTLPDASAAH